MRAPELTKSQLRVLIAFKEAAATGDAPPTLRELCKRFGWGSTGTARDHLKALVRKGRLRREAGARNYRIADAPELGAAVPIIGRVAAGHPILAVEYRDGEVTVPASWTRKGTAFAVRVEGQSMTGAGIQDGDIIVARATPTAIGGDIVVARKGDNVTVKRLRIRRGVTSLQAENPAFDAIAVDNETAVLGVAVGLIRTMGQRRETGGSSWGR
jgi:repressor LexA